MASRAEKVVVPVVVVYDFDNALYDNCGSNNVVLDQAAMQERTSVLLQRFNSIAVKPLDMQRAAEDAVDSCIASCLGVVDMLYVPRDDEPMSAISLMTCSWQEEAVPEPCSVDTWLRSALPHAKDIPSVSYAMAQFLSSGGASATVGARTGTTNRNQLNSSARRSVTISNTGASPTTSLVPPPATPHADSSSVSGVGSATPVIPLRRRAGSNDQETDTAPLSSEAEAMEKQLRVELEVRSAQRDAARVLAQKDAAERAHLASLQGSLKGASYTYDHKGNVLIMAGFDPDKLPQEALAGPGFKVGVPPVAGGGGEAVLAGSGAAGAKGLAAAGRSVGTKGGSSRKVVASAHDRKLQQDFRELASRTQPSVLQTMAMTGGVTLRQGTAAKSGPVRAKAARGLTREEYARMVRDKQLSAEAGPATGSLSLSSVGGGGDSHGGHQQSHGGQQQTGQQGKGPRVSRSRTPSPVPGMIEGGSGKGEGPLAGVPPGPDIMTDTRPRLSPLAAEAARRVPTPDINIALTRSSNWGVSMNSGFAPSSEMLLPPVKPSERQRELEVGRTMRLPRARASQATMSPPLSPPMLPSVQSGRVWG